MFGGGGRRPQNGSGPDASIDAFTTPSSRTPRGNLTPYSQRDKPNSPPKVTLAGPLEDASVESSITASATGENRIKVGVRMRPLLHRDREENTHLEINEAESNVFVEKPDQLTFSYDSVFGPFSSHERIYDECAADVVRGCLEGVFAQVDRGL